MNRKYIAALMTAALTTWAVQATASPAENLAQALTYRTISYQDHETIDYGELSKLHEFLRATYPRVFSELNVEVINQYSLFIRWPGTDQSAEPILFTAHMDVVPVEPGTEGDWDHPPFAGVIADGKIYGRGTLDDKLGVIGLLEAAEQLLAEGFKPRRSITLAFGHDEEISGLGGAAAIAARMRELDLHYAWMVDEGGMIIGDNPLLPGREIGLVNVAEKSCLTLTLVAEGPGGHSSTPPRVSTIGRLSAALARIEQNPFAPRLSAPVAAMMETLGPYNSQPTRLILGNLWLTSGLVAGQLADDPLMAPFARTTTALTMINAGVKENVVPQRAEAKINFRLLPGDTAEQVVVRVEQLVDDPEITISHSSWDERTSVAEYPGGGFAVIAEATKSVYPDAIMTPSLLPGATDTRHYLAEADNHYRYHGAYMSTSQARSIHGTNEYIAVDSFENSVEIAQQMMRLGSK